MYEQQPSPDLPPQAGHERSDVSPRSIAIAVCAMGIFLAFSLTIVTGLFRWFEASGARHDSPGNLLLSDQAPPKPRLQSDPEADLAILRADEEQRLSNYGWIDEEKQIVRIPIRTAMEILAKRGFPEPGGPAELPAAEEHKP